MRATLLRCPGRTTAPSLFLYLAVFLCCLLPLPARAQETDRYWELGVGCYFGGLGALTELDVARYDWLYLCFGNIGAKPETTELLNRLLEINPDLKIVIRVWPIMSLGDCEENRYQATFLHYLYKPGVKEKLIENIHQQVRVVLDNISKPENVVGLTFLEELPGHFSGGPFRQNVTGDEVTWDLERFREEIEAERGKPLVWDDDTRRWWGEKWVQALGEIHAAMKEASEGRLVWYYQQTNHRSLDMVPEGTPLETRMLMPIHWEDIIKPGLCDGFFAYPNNESVWGTYLRLAREHNWLLFSQVSHPGAMRLCSWEECLKMAKTEVPQNMGYFFYCSGECAAKNAWNDDPGIPLGPEWNTRGISAKLHIRRHLALEDVGMDIVRRQPALRLHVDLPLAGAGPGQLIHPRVIVENTRQASFYPDPDEAIARKVTVTLTPPAGFVVDPNASAPPTLELGDLMPGERRLADWYVRVKRELDGKLEKPLVVTGKAEGGPPTVLEAGEDTSVPFALPHEIGLSGTAWMEAAFRLPVGEVQPTIALEALGAVSNPSVSDGTDRIRYDGTLEQGMRLVMDPREGSRLFVLPLLDDDGASRADENDATGFRSFDDGYLVVRIRVGRAVETAVPLRVTVAGKAEAGGQSLVVLRFKMAEGQKDVSVLVKRFGEEWREAEAEATPPEGAVALDWVYLYRFKQEGKVWYGPAKVERTDIGGEGQDVSERVRGAFPSLSRNTFKIFRYEDDDPPSLRPRIRVQLIVPDQ